MWRWKLRKQPAPTENQAGSGTSEDRLRARLPSTLTSQQKRIISLGESGRYGTALDEILRGLRQKPDDSFLLKAAMAVAGARRTANLEAAEPATVTQRTSALLAPIATVCSSCGGLWYSKHRPASEVYLINTIGLQCQTCRYTLCRDCLISTRLSPADRIDRSTFVMGWCPERGHGRLSLPVLATGRTDVTSIKPDCIEAVIVTRHGPIPSTMDEALDVALSFVPLTRDDAPLIHIRSSKPGVMAEKTGRDELAITLIHDLERQGILAKSALNRSECIFTGQRHEAGDNYLLIVIGKASASHPETPGSPLLH